MPYIILAVAVVLIGSLLFFTSSRDNETTGSQSDLTPEVTGELIETTPVSDREEDSQPSTELVETVPVPNREEPIPVPEAESDPAVSGLNPDLSPEQEAVVSGYVDGVYTAQASYFTPRRTEHSMDITLTLSDGVITDANVLYDNSGPQTPNHNAFDNAYKEEVVGKALDEISLSRVGGASLTSESFNEAVDKIKQEAAT